MIETSIFSVLQAQPAIAALVGTAVYPVLLPLDSPLPALTYQIVGSSSMQGLTTHGMQRLRLQVDCWANTYLAAVTLRDAVATSMDLYEDSDFSALLLGKTDFYEDAALMFRAMLELYLFTNQF